MLGVYIGLSWPSTPEAALYIIFPSVQAINALDNNSQLDFQIFQVEQI